MFKTKDYIPRVSSRDRCRKNKLLKETIAVKVAFAIKFSCAKAHYIAPTPRKTDIRGQDHPRDSYVQITFPKHSFPYKS